MKLSTKIIFTASIIFAACTQGRAPVIDKAFIDTILGEFTEERARYYLLENKPRSNIEILEKVLERRGLNVRVFMPKLRHTYPGLAAQLSGKTS
ncbi:MAG: hypothetical protein LDLANPLL_01526 [Turneriella sp.]|nr:hypothetical protein [Turneriella sp.]